MVYRVYDQCSLTHNDISRLDLISNECAEAYAAAVSVVPGRVAVRFDCDISAIFFPAQMVSSVTLVHHSKKWSVVMSSIVGCRLVLKNQICWHVVHLHGTVSLQMLHKYR